jgi:hypothetical protein
MQKGFVLLKKLKLKKEEIKELEKTKKTLILQK